MCYDKMKSYQGVIVLLENILYNLIYALICGFTEFLCADSASHIMLYEFLTGRQQADPLLKAFVRIGLLLGVVISCWERIRQLWRERKMSMRSRHRQNWQSNPIVLLDLRFLATASFPVLASVFLYRFTGNWISGLVPLATVVALNGMILFVPRLVRQGNKDGRSVSRLNALLIGAASALGSVTGFSRTGAMLSTASMCGLDRTYAYDMVLLLSLPVLLGLLCFDIVAVIAAGIAFSLVDLLVYCLSAALAFGASWLTILLMRFLSVKIGFSGFAFYSWGFALFTFILYLTI